MEVAVAMMFFCNHGRRGYGMLPKAIVMMYINTPGKTVRWKKMVGFNSVLTLMLDEDVVTTFVS